ncbi:phage tail tube protein [Defluviimonas sp. D31]|uniref:phage tail tube protein n=1 Tax=Defluviimonas sp. D31 TaxID=3083253 RepID=UPI00296EB25F|nr:phage tail tube protein [Defluviimonas sp. D31]MDW4550883.1 phage tail tube protein [Defluviimonas sp. D31]
MTATAGQDAIFKIGATPVAGVRVSGFTRNATPIDITDRDSAGYQELLAGKVAGASLSMNVEGLFKGQTLRALALGAPSGWTLADASLVLANGDTIAGTFFLGDYQEGDDHKDATTFSATLASSGAWTFTPAP